jgi:cytosine/adenosine deaminase-related metal-dependent hydrolase
MTHYKAAWILPISGEPIRDGWIAVDRGRVAALGARATAGTSAVDLGSVAILPGLVNAHTHLELSYMRDEVPPASEFVAWIRGVMVARRARPDVRSPEILSALEAAVVEATRAGTALVGDISNTLVTVAPLIASPLAGVVFYELIRFNAPDPQGFVEEANAALAALPQSNRVRTSLAAHAPYSVGPLVLRAIRESVDRTPFAPCSIHLSESVEEIEFIHSGSGPWRAFLEEVGAWDPQWVPPGGSPVQFLDESGFLNARVLAIHGVQMTTEDLERLAARGATLVTCPRSNFHTGAGAPPIEEFYASGVHVAVGTDSLASTPDLNMFAELATMRALAPTVPARQLLDSATRQGARALGFDAEFGTIEPGKSARLIAVDVPPDVEDVEEYLVGGVQPAQIKWLNEAGSRGLGD